MDNPWPEKGDKAFRDGPRACHMQLGRSLGLAVIADGFKEASDILVDYLQQHPRNDALVHPIIFGYRQCLELRIKALTATATQFDTGRPDFKWGHRLGELWQHISPRLREELEQQEEESFQIVEQVIMEFDDIDERGDGFRYPEVVDQFNIDLPNMRGVIEKVSDFLESLNDLWDAGLSAQG
ncbi:MAG: hypothetical protein O3C40_26600 [Planctomycetota bacterium]|nr:hypothetical protein [Planctomycetota bacterium]